MTASAKISGIAFADPNANGIKDTGEAAVSGLVVDLLDSTGNRIATQTTSASGAYVFDGLDDGIYSLHFKPLIAQVTSGPFLRGTVGDFELRTGYTSVDNIYAYQNATTIFNEGMNSTAAFRGVVFVDANGNGKYDAGEASLSGAIVTLRDSNGSVVDTTTSSHHDYSNATLDGVFSFAGLKPGTYSYSVAPTGGTATNAFSSQSIVLAAGANTGSRNLALSGSPDHIIIGGTIYSDSNGDGLLSAGETGIRQASVALFDSSGHALLTTTSDSSGHYSFSSVTAGSYTVVVASPDGLASSSPRPLTTSMTTDGLNKGFVPDADVAKTGDVPASSTINVVIRGQSNARYITTNGLMPVIKEDIEHLLGFDGISHKVNIVGDWNNSDGSNTEWGGTGLTTNWLTANGGDYTKGWTANVQELGLLSALGKLSAADRANPTAIVWLHNENDSLNSGLTTDLWESAVRYEAGLVRATLGQDAGTTPYLFVNAIPFQGAIKNQDIRVGQTRLTEDSKFNAAFAVSQSSDVDMDVNLDVTKPVLPGSLHGNQADSAQWAHRIALGVAEEFRASALSGSPLALAGGNIDDAGPQVVFANAVFGHSRQVVLTFQFDAASGLLPLSSSARLGAGWSLRADYTDASPDAVAVRADLLGNNKLLLTFDHEVVAGEKLFYGWGGDRIALTNLPGIGAAVYDDQNMPAWVDARGLSVVSDFTSPILTLGARPPAQVEATSAAGAPVVFAAASTDAVDGADPVVFKEGQAVVVSGQTFGLGAHTVVASATDRAGNAAVPIAFDFTVADTTRPNLTLSARPSAQVEATSAAGAPVVFTAASNDAVDGADPVVFREGQAVVVSGQTFGLGAHTVTASATDCAGNAAVPVSFDFTVASTPIAKADALTLSAHTIATGNLLANDISLGGNALHVTTVRTNAGTTYYVANTGEVTIASQHGILTIGSDGHYSYLSQAAGAEFFTYIAGDGHGGAASSTLTVTAAAPAPASDATFAFAFTQANVGYRNGDALLTGPDGMVHDVTGIGHLHFTDGTIDEARGSALVDDLYYDAHNLDVWRAHVDPEQHYAQYGWHEGRDPNAFFSTAAYLAANPDVAAAGVNPLTHYDMFGWREGRSPGPGFSGEAYLAANPDVAAAKVDPLAHYLGYGQAEGRAAFPGLTIAQGGGHHLYGDFDATYYLATNADVATAARTQTATADSFAFTHYLTYGAREGRDPDAYFSTTGYLAANPDVAASGTNPLLHYEQSGWFQGRDPSAAFHTAAYLAANPDVAAAGMDPLHHYLQFGLAEGRHLA
ncbi:carboxypeptidase regulatory-like domain-containing protein [Methylobacterium sp. J-059]|uniref:SdrD B-like domain-containing protein n=1 Tax=Methylobacterium sp. J-059 TaxID=2836643 RepID=UPI001FBBD755|nr:SdrD B-like domain-containing protein [Methylobacterium sp. J-059]MCJ2038566.1 carboxypeptidase regulatory-like domain-containing protein [Methylobacterium sp. J-059]